MHTPNNPYYDGGLMMGVIMGSLFAFISIGLWARGHFVIALLAGLFIVGLCWISGTRSSWVSVITTLLALPIVAWVRGYRTSGRAYLGIFGVIALGMFAGSWIIKQPGLSSKLNQTLVVFQNPSLQTLDQALSGRLDIWIDAVAIGNENPGFGAGVNNYRYAAPLVDSPAGVRWISEIDDPDSPHKLQGAAHTHQVVMETLSGAGWVGVAGLVLFYIMLTRLTLNIFAQPTLLATATVLAFWAYFWPINTHNNFHGGWVNAWFWVWLGLTIGTYYAPKTREHWNKPALN
jgi:O-antigen ligase